MQELVCNSCGGKEFQERDGKRVCSYCGTVYLSVTTGTTIALDEDIRKLLMKCRLFPDKASVYANLVLDIDPGNEEALRYL